MSEPQSNESALRPVIQSDAEGLLSLFNRLERETPFFPWLPGERGLTVTDIKDRLAECSSGGRHILVAERDGEVAGYVDIRRASLRRLAHGAFLELGISKAHWGVGLGKQMMRAAEDWARQNDVIRIAFPVVGENFRAISLYLRLGYSVEGCRRRVYRIDERLVDEYMMAKLLD